MQLLKLNDNVKNCASLDYMVRKIWKMEFNLNSDSWESLWLQEIKPADPKGKQSWICFGSWSSNSNTLATWCEELTHWRRPWCWERLKTGEEREDRGWNGWMISLTRWTTAWAHAPGVGDGQGSLVCCSLWGHKESDTTEWLNWTGWMWGSAYMYPLCQHF